MKFPRKLSKKISTWVFTLIEIMSMKTSAKINTNQRKDSMMKPKWMWPSKKFSPQNSKTTENEKFNEQRIRWNSNSSPLTDALYAHWLFPASTSKTQTTCKDIFQTSCLLHARNQSENAESKKYLHELRVKKKSWIRARSEQASIKWISLCFLSYTWISIIH